MMERKGRDRQREGEESEAMEKSVERESEIRGKGNGEISELYMLG